MNTANTPTHTKNAAQQMRKALAAVMLGAALAAMTACTDRKTTKSNEEALAHIAELGQQAKELQHTQLDSAIHLQIRALDALQDAPNDSLHAVLLTDLGLSYSIKEDLKRSDSCYTAAEAEAANCPGLAIRILINRAINQDKRGHPDAALALYDTAYTRAKQSTPPDEVMMRRIDINRAVSHQQLAHFDSAMICLERAMRLAEKQDDREGVAAVIMNMGNVKYRIRDDEQADSLFRLAEAIYSELGDTRMIIKVKTNRISTKVRLGLYDEALAISLQAEHLADSIGAKALIGSLYNNRGSIYFEQHDYRRSLDILNRSMALKKELGDTVGMIASINSMASVHIEMKDYATAIHESMEALHLSNERNVTTYLDDIYQNLATACGRSGQFRLAVEYLERKSALRDSIFTKEKYTVMEEMRTRYETEQHEQSLQIAMLQLKKNRLGLVALAALFVLLGVSFVYVYTAQRRRLRQYISIARQSERVDELTERTLLPQCGSDDEEQRAAGLSEDKTNDLLRSLRDCMEVHKMYCDPELTLESLATAIGTNRSYLSILINSRMKQGFSEYVNFYRIKEAKRLLKDTDHKVSTISVEVGFGTQQSFYTAFRAAEQLTPTQYRKAARKG